MAAPVTDILPGFVTPQAAAALQAGLVQAEATRRDLERDVDPWDDEFPAALTGYDSTYGTCSWYEQTYDSAGQRIEKSGGRTGTFIVSPAYPVGNGVMPPPDITGSGSAGGWPVEVRLTRRLMASTGDAAGTVVYEFPWWCACDSGSGS